MADIPIYSSLEEKREFFSNEDFFVIDTKEELDRWFQYYSSDFKKERPVDFIFRGMSDAQYKLFTSAQRMWITDNMVQWRNNFSYKNFIEKLVKKAKQNRLLKKVFDLYGYGPRERDFPIISLLQHYGAPTPVLDWSYNINSAVYFAVDGVKRGSGNDINNYISVYSIHKKKLSSRKELITLYDFANKYYPAITDFRDYGDEKNPNGNSLFLLSDFELSTQVPYPNKLVVQSTKPMTSLYNQNIIPQEGLLMYNPYMDRPIEQMFNVDPLSEGQNLHLEPFKCFNIHKDLSEYLRRLIDTRYGINKGFMYPYLYDDGSQIKESVLNEIVKV